MAAALSKRSSLGKLAVVSGTKFYAYGYGMAGCLFDGASGPYDSEEEAAQAAQDHLDLRDRERSELLASGIIWFSGKRRATLAIGDYIELFEVDADWSWDDY